MNERLLKIPLRDSLNADDRKYLKELAEKWVDVVYCSECKFSINSSLDFAYKCTNKNTPCYYRTVTADDFCAYGKIKEN